MSIDAVKTAVKQLALATQGVVARVNDAPVVLLGNQKSGTTAIAALLGVHTGCSVSLDLRGIYEPVQTRLHSGDLSFLDFVRANKLDFSRDIVKEPSLTFLYEPLRSRFPDARFVMIVRDPRANIRSILNRLSLPGDMEDVRAPDLDGVSPEWQKVLDSRWLGVEGATYIDQLAGRWCLAADAYLQHRGEMLLIRYEDFEADKPGTIAQLAKTLGLPARHDVGAQADRQFQPRGNRSVSWTEFFGARNLDRIERICGERMEMLGYSPRST